MTSRPQSGHSAATDRPSPARPATAVPPGSASQSAVEDGPQALADKAIKTAADVASQTGAAAKQAAAAAVETAQDAADQAVTSAKSSAADVAERSKGWTRDRIRSISRAIHAGSQSLEEDGMTATAGYVRSAAQGLMQAADGVDDVNARRLTDRAEDFVRERPIISVAALALAGFALASVLRKGRD